MSATLVPVDNIVRLQPHCSLDMLVQWEPSKAGEAAFYSGLDNFSGTLRIMGAGSWNAADADRYFDVQRKLIATARARFGSLKAFFDVRDWVVDSPMAALQFQAINAELHHPDDRIVAVVRASVEKQHPRTALSVGNREVFLSVNAAETWLQAYSASRSVA